MCAQAVAAAAPQAAPPRSAEAYLEAAWELDASGFLGYFERAHPRLYRNYEDLCRNHGMLVEYHANPVVFILANQPKCCTDVAMRFVDDQTAGAQPTAAPQATQASRSRSRTRSPRRSTFSGAAPSPRPRV